MIVSVDQAAPMRDINLLPNSPGDDPRTLEKLADGVNNTFDDEHMWLAPYDPQCVVVGFSAVAL